MICEIRKSGVFSVGECLPEFVMCDNGLAFVDKCQDGYNFDETDMLCKTPNEIFCQHLVTEKTERSCDNQKVNIVSDQVAPAPSSESLLKTAPTMANHEDEGVVLAQLFEDIPISTTDSSLLKTAPLLTNGEYAAPLSTADSSLLKAGPMLANHENVFDAHNELYKAAQLSTDDSSFVKAAPMLANHENVFDDDKELHKAAPLSTDDSSFVKAGPMLANHQNIFDADNELYKAAQLSTDDSSF
uniref:Chitin-binding type-2 domain-containing protein n=1 Tax=Panagrolaimus sp. ES5 TaxID=591445 RepID=A0AC34GPL1_9BILA